MSKTFVRAGWSVLSVMAGLVLVACQGSGEHTPVAPAANSDGQQRNDAATAKNQTTIPDALLETMAGPNAADLAALRQKAAAIEARAASFDTDHGLDAAEGPGAATSFTLYRENGELKMAEETVGDPSGGDTTFASYYFDGGRLFRYQAFASRAGQDLSTDMYFDERGRLLEAVRQADGRDATVADDEVAAATRRARELLGK